MGAAERWRAMPVVQVRAPALACGELPSTPAPGDPGRLAALWQVDRLRAAITAAAPDLAAAVTRALAGPGADDSRLSAAAHRYAVRVTTRATPRGLLAAVGFTTWVQPTHGSARAGPDGGGVRTGASGPGRPALPDERFTANPSLHVRPTEGVAVFQVPGEAVERELRLAPAALDHLATWTEPLAAAAAPFSASEVTALAAAGALVGTRRPTAPEPWPAGAAPGAGAAPTVVTWTGGGEATDGSGPTDLHWADPPALAVAIRRRAEQAAGALARLGQALPADPALERYAAAYEALFAGEVTALDRVLDPLRGLGRPQPPETATSPELAALLLRLIDRAGTGCAAELTDADLDRLPRYRPAVASCDAFFQLAGDLLALTPRGVTAPAGRAHARFAHLDPAVAAIVASADRHEGRAHPRADRAIFDYWHDAMIDLAVGAAPDLPVLLWSSTGAGRPVLRRADLALTVDDGLPQLRSRRSGRPLQVHPHHLVNMAGAPWLLHVVHRMSMAPRAVPAWSWGSFAATHVRLPRVSYAGVVLAPARWRVPEGGEHELAAWRERHGVPRWVRIDDGDLGVRLDLDVAADRALLRVGEAGTSRWVIEALDRPGEAVVEVVVPLLRELGHAGASRGDPPRRDDAPGDTADAAVAESTNSRDAATGPDDEPDVLQPGDRWWAVHLPTRNVDQENLVLRLLGSYLAPGRGAPIRAGAAGGTDGATVGVRPGGPARQPPAWFYVRYNVPQPHLRIRVRADAVDLEAFLAAVRRVCAATTASGFSLEPYRREPGRFGPGRVALAERVFCADAAACLGHLPPVAAALRTGIEQLAADPATVAAVLIARAHRGLGLDLAGSTRLLERQVPPPFAADRGARAHEHAQRKVLRDLLSRGHDAETGRDADPVAAVAANSFIPGPASTHLAIATGWPDRARAALAHLHLNRLGCDPRTEAVARARLLAAQRSRTTRP